MTTPEERIAQQIAAAEQKAKDHAKKVRQLKAQQQAMEARKLSGLLKGNGLTTPAEKSCSVP